jgi:hypothetical protein
MSKEIFLPVFVLGCGALALWVAQRLPGLAPRSLRAAGLHLVAALVVGTVLGPVLRAVPGQPSALSLFVALFAVALPALTYMLLAGVWLIRVAAGAAPAPRG